MYKLFVGVLLAAVVAVRAPKNDLKQKDSELTITMQYDGALGVQDVKRDLVLGDITPVDLRRIVLDSNRKVVDVSRNDAGATSVRDIQDFSDVKAHLIFITWPSSQPPCASFVLATRDGTWSRYFQYFGGDESPFLYAALLDRQGHMKNDPIRKYKMTVYKTSYGGKTRHWSCTVGLTDMQRDHLDKISVKITLGSLSVASMTFSPLKISTWDASWYPQKKLDNVEFTWNKPSLPNYFVLTRLDGKVGWTHEFKIRSPDFGSSSADVQSKERDISPASGSRSASRMSSDEGSA